MEEIVSTGKRTNEPECVAKPLWLLMFCDLDEDPTADQLQQLDSGPAFFIRNYPMNLTRQPELIRVGPHQRRD